MMSLTFDLFTQVSGSGPLGPLVVMSFFPRDVLDVIWDLIDLVSEDFSTYSSLFIELVEY